MATLHYKPASTLLVFSHPNHELATYGLIRRLRPYLLYLTDGGGEERVEQTRQGLRGINAIERAYFLNYTEQSFYDALLACDVSFFHKVTAGIRNIVNTVPLLQIWCDAVQFYNPVHDMSLPLVVSALRGTPDPPVYEIPLVHQVQGETETYEVQRMPVSERAGEIRIKLTREEFHAKLHARDHIYSILMEQMGPTLFELPDEYFLRETLAPARQSRIEPGGDRVLRYEWRAQRLLEEGRINKKINYNEHVLPLTNALVAHGTMEPL